MEHMSPSQAKELSHDCTHDNKIKKHPLADRSALLFFFFCRNKNFFQILYMPLTFDPKRYMDKMRKWGEKWLKDSVLWRLKPKCLFFSILRFTAANHFVFFLFRHPCRLFVES